MAIDRDPAFWTQVATHPEVAPHVLFGHSDLLVADVVQHPNVIPMRFEHGGFIFARLDGVGRVYELHTLFTPEGWGREVNAAAKDAFEVIFAQASVVVTYEVEGWKRSQPPRSFGFIPAGDFQDSTLGPSLRTWVLTREAWINSPAWRRKCPSQQ